MEAGVSVSTETLAGAENKYGVELNGINVIPEHERGGAPRSQFWPWFASNVSVFGISMAAFVFGFGLNFFQSLAAAVIGIVFSFTLVGIVSLAGKRASAPTMAVSRAAFGVHGNALPTIVSYLLLVGWEIVLVALSTLATATVLGTLGWATGDGVKIVAFLVVVAIVVFAGVVGFRFVMRLQTFITIASLILTAMYMVLTLGSIKMDVVTSAAAGTPEAFIGAIVFAMTGFGIGWVNCGADYSRYLPRNASGKALFGWTTFGASVAPVILILYGLLLVASSSDLQTAIGSDPAGALTTILPNSAVVLLPFLFVVLMGQIGGASLDIYSSGLALLSLGLRIPRYLAAGVDGVLMILGSIYVLWIADSFFGPFQGFLYLLGVPMAAWAGAFIADMISRKRDYSEADLFTSKGRYGSIGWPAFGTMIVATIVGWGLVVSFYSEPWLAWQGYLLSAIGITSDSPWYYSNIGILAALGIGFFGTLVLGRARIARQEAAA
jgi:nucleobase:cation symporter-1, NCS1 family